MLVVMLVVMVLVVPLFLAELAMLVRANQLASCDLTIEPASEICFQQVEYRLELQLIFPSYLAQSNCF